MIKETIVVEGKNDAQALKRAFGDKNVDIIITSGFGINKKILDLIKTAQEKKGVIVLTDPDYMGEKIRTIVSEKVKGVKHAFIPREEARCDKDVGVENASPESIRKALEKAKTEVEPKSKPFTTADLIEYGLSGEEGSTERRAAIGAILGIGYGNAKQFLSRLNRYGITRAEFEAAFWDAEELYKI